MWSASLLSLYDPFPNLSLCYVFFNRCTIFLPNILSSALLCLWFLFNLTNLFYHSSIELGGLSASINLLLILLFNSLLNSSMKGCLSYPLSLVIFLNFWTYLLYILPLYSIVLNCFTFLSSSSVFLNSFFIFFK